MENVSERLKRIRDITGWTQRELGERLGASASWMTRLEQGERPATRTLELLLTRLEGDLARMVFPGATPALPAHEENRAMAARKNPRNTPKAGRQASGGGGMGRNSNYTFGTTHNNQLTKFGTQLQNMIQKLTQLQQSIGGATTGGQAKTRLQGRGQSRGQGRGNQQQSAANL